MHETQEPHVASTGISRRQASFRIAVRISADDSQELYFTTPWAVAACA